MYDLYNIVSFSNSVSKFIISLIKIEFWNFPSKKLNQTIIK
jgi:hypothetical protein